ncbi:MAG: hypothetical protein MUF52_14305 [Syntrophobacteraceae bacterium]|jgi:hypothetical protein|nr:hypothetical protein [Syntrophobacteraceae bacterium]
MTVEGIGKDNAFCIRVLKHTRTMADAPGGLFSAMNETFPVLILVKALTAVGMVVMLSVLAEVVSTRFAGILSGYPLGAAISLFFMGYEISPQFAAQSALHTSVGLIATQAFAYSYYRTSLLQFPSGRVGRVVLASLGGLLAYGLAASLLRRLEVDPTLAVLMPTLFILLFVRLFRRVENTKIRNRSALSVKTLLLRAFFAATAIIAITSTARWVGPAWSGIFAAFPITLLPFVAIIHYTYASDHAHAILKNVPRGLGSLVVYSLAVSTFYPSLGVPAGTILAYALATLYLVVIQLASARPRTAHPKED